MLQLNACNGRLRNAKNHILHAEHHLRNRLQRATAQVVQILHDERVLSVGIRRRSQKCQCGVAELGENLMNDGLTARYEPLLRFPPLMTAVFADNHAATVDITANVRLSEALENQIGRRLKQRGESRLVLPHEVLEEAANRLYDVFVLPEHRENLAEQTPVLFEIVH